MSYYIPAQASPQFVFPACMIVFHAELRQRHELRDARCRTAQQLTDIPEVALSGFSVREGLAGTGVTVLKGRNYFGSWRLVGAELVWTFADLSEPSRAVPSVDEAVRYTLLLILRDIQTTSAKPQSRALAS